MKDYNEKREFIAFLGLAVTLIAICVAVAISV